MRIQDALTKKHTTSREPITPRWIVVHDTEGTDSLDWLAYNPEAITSVQYLIARTGLIYRIGKETWACWHAGRTKWDGSTTTLNYSSVGIEIEHRSGVEPYPPAQLAALEDLILDIASRWTIKGVVSHKEIAWPRGRKSDPELDVDHYSIAAIRARRKPQPTQEEPDMTDAQWKMLRELKLSAVARSYDVGIIKAVVAGDSAAVSRLEVERDAAVVNKRRELGL